MAENYDDRPLRFCDTCTKVDRAPRHVQWVLPGAGASDEAKITRALDNATTSEERAAVVIALKDETRIEKHMDCCAEDGCQVCADQLEWADGAKDEELAVALAPKEG